MEKKVLFKKVEGLVLPAYESELASGMDVRANFLHTTKEECDKRLKVNEIQTGVNPRGVPIMKKSRSLVNYDSDKTYVIIAAGERYLIPTGLFVAIPEGLEAQIRPRSGLALKKAITILNTPGTIDGDYRGEIGVIVINHSKTNVVIAHSERICQIVFTPVERISWGMVNELPTTKRGEGGFNSTGTK